MTFLQKIRDGYNRVDRAYKLGYNRIFHSCEDMTRLASEALDRRLSFRERLARRLHLLVCTWCRRYDRQLRFLRTQYRTFADHEPLCESDRLSDDARRRILDRCSHEDDGS